MFLFVEPGAVKNLTVNHITTTSVSLNWLPPEGFASAYQIQINGNSNSTLNTTYTITGLSPGNVYTVVVTALVGDKVQGEESKAVVKTSEYCDNSAKYC